MVQAFKMFSPKKLNRLRLTGIVLLEWPPINLVFFVCLFPSADTRFCATQQDGSVWTQSEELSTPQPHWTASLLMSMTTNTPLSSSPWITVSWNCSVAERKFSLQEFNIRLSESFLLSCLVSNGIWGSANHSGMLEKTGGVRRPHLAGVKSPKGCP